MTRFVAGQDIKTVDARLKFLQTFNKYSEVARESYKWQRYMQGGRATLEEDLEDINARIKLNKAQAELDNIDGDLELAELERKARHLKVKIDIAESEKTLEGIKKGPPPPPPAPPLVLPRRRRARCLKSNEPI